MMISAEILDRAAGLLLGWAPTGSQVILFGSQARRTATGTSDADFLIIEPELSDRHGEMVRLRKVLRPLRISADIVVVSRFVYDNWKDTPNTLLYDAAGEGKDYGIAA